MTYLLNLYKKSPLEITHGEGMYLYDSAHNKYLDFYSGIAVNALGHADQELLAAICQQAHKFIHLSSLYLTELAENVAKKLVQTSFSGQVFFANSGTEANEAAIKLARKKSLTGNPEKTEFVAFEHAFHGRSMGSLALTHKKSYRAPFGELPGPVKFLSFDISQLEQITDSTCAVFIEPIQGEGGIHAPTHEFMVALRKRCDDVDAILIYDEIQCGLGRTGSMWAYQSLNFPSPDLMTVAKPLGGGLPLGALLVSEKLTKVLVAGEHGSTFGGNPVALAAAQVVLNRLDEKFLNEIKFLAKYLNQELTKLIKAFPTCFTDARCFGFMIGIDVTSDVQEWIADLQKAKILVTSSGNSTLRLLPPLVCQKTHVDEFIEVLAKVAQERSQ